MTPQPPERSPPNNNKQTTNSVDGRKLLFVGLGMFTGVTGCLYPLTVVKTRQMAGGGPGVSPGLSGMVATAKALKQQHGPRGFYRGFGTVVFGTIPGRSVYLYALEATKAAVQRAAEGGGGGHGGAQDGGGAGVGGSSGSGNANVALAAAIHAVAGGWTPAQVSAAANFAGGAVGSLAAQAVAVPVDVVSQRQMVAAGGGAGGAGGGGAAAPGNGLAMARHIVRAEGVAGLYRGFWASVATFVPNSAVWWGAYGFYRKALAGALEGGGGSGGSTEQAAPPSPASGGVVVAVQTASAVAAGLTSGLLSTPLDVVKTRLQLATADNVAGAAAATAGPARPSAPSPASSSWLGVARDLVAQDGARGLLRGAVPRMLSSALWGTAMVSTWETLKRVCVVEEGEEEEQQGGGRLVGSRGGSGGGSGKGGGGGGGRSSMTAAVARRRGAPAAAL
jgi:solute carrier family 25 protein 44